MDRMLMTFRSSQIPSTWKFMQLSSRMVLPCVDHVLIVDWRQATGVMQEMLLEIKALGVQLSTVCRMEMRLIGFGISVKAPLSALIATGGQTCAISVVVKIGAYRLITITDGKGELKLKQLPPKQGGMLKLSTSMLDTQHLLD